MAWCSRQFVHGNVGRHFPREMLAALDALPEKKLIANERTGGDVCALGAVNIAANSTWSALIEDTHTIADALHRLIRWRRGSSTRTTKRTRDTPEERFAHAGVVAFCRWTLTKSVRLRRMV